MELGFQWYEWGIKKSLYKVVQDEIKLGPYNYKMDGSHNHRCHFHSSQLEELVGSISSSVDFSHFIYHIQIM